MSTLTWSQAAKDAWDAGFRGSDYIRILATAFAESSLNTNPPGNPTHRGILQFDAGTAQQAGFSWSDMLDPRKAFKAAYNLVYGKSGAPRRGFQPWQGDGYQRYMSQARDAALGFNPNNPGAGPNLPQSGTGFGIGGYTLPSFPDAASIGGAVSNAAMDAGRSLLPYLIILAIIGFGAILVLSGLRGDVTRAAVGSV